MSIHCFNIIHYYLFPSTLWYFSECYGLRIPIYILCNIQWHLYIHLYMLMKARTIKTSRLVNWGRWCWKREMYCVIMHNYHLIFTQAHFLPRYYWQIKRATKSTTVELLHYEITFPVRLCYKYVACHKYTQYCRL